MTTAIIEVNEAFEEGTGHKREDVIGKTASDLALWLHPEQRLQLLEQLKIDGPRPQC